MQRTTPVLSTVILGVVLAASLVNAQQVRSARNEAVDPSASSTGAAGSSSTSKTIGDPVYGMSSPRPARYLLRNGVDYLNYREYERALKFLRETELRKDELNDAEKLVLKQSIEKAQRGLRHAADAESPYALSAQASNRNGFSPAKSDTRVASRNNHFNKSTQKLAVQHANASSPTVSNSDDQGERIQLASGEVLASELSAQNLVAPRSNPTDANNSATHHNSDRPRQFQEIPKLSGSSYEVNEPNTPSSELNSNGNQAIKQPASIRPHENAQEFTPVPKQDSAPDLTSSARPAPFSVAIPSSNVDILAQLPPVELAPKENLIPPVEDLEIEKSLSRGARAALADDLTSAAHTETEENSSIQKDISNVSVSPPTEAFEPSLPVITNKADDPPTLRTAQNLAVDIANRSNHALRPSTPQSSVVTVTSVNNDALPPLPSNLAGIAVPQHPAAELTPPATFTTNSLKADLTMSDDLPPLPSDLGHPSMQFPNASASLAMSSTVQDPSFGQPSAAQANDSMTSLNPSRRPFLAHSPSSSSDEATLPAYDEKTDRAAPSAMVSSTSVPVITAGQRAASLPKLPSVASEPVVPLDPTSAGQDPESIQEVAVANPTIEESRLPSVLPPAIENPKLSSLPVDSMVPSRPTPTSTLRPELKHEVEMVVQKQEDDLRLRQNVQRQPAPSAHNTIISDLRAQTQLDISRAPSPAEARPIKAIPVPEDWVPLVPRSWTAQRKYWAAAATCHLPLYFQDPVLERYGHSVEQFVGPIGRYLTYPLDDPTQSTQRNQILQPFFSAGLFALQIAALPYNAIMDPPWEAQYDLGYYRPGDVIPTDTYWLPLHGYGPPLRGSNY